MSVFFVCQFPLLVSYLTPAIASTATGLYSHRISGGQLVVPRKVNHLGHHLSHDLTHHWTEDDDDDGGGLTKRRRRFVGEPAALHYHLELNNETLHIELEYVEQSGGLVHRKLIFSVFLFIFSSPTRIVCDVNCCIRWLCGLLYVCYREQTVPRLFHRPNDGRRETPERFADTKELPGGTGS